MPFRVESPLGVPLASLGSRAAGVPSSLRLDRSAPLRPLTQMPGAAGKTHRSVMGRNERLRATIGAVSMSGSGDP